MADWSPAVPFGIRLQEGEAPVYGQADAALVSALQAGEEDAYETLIQRYQTSVYNLVYRLLDDPEDAPDVLQEVFLKVFRKISAFRAQASLKTWIYRIAVNEALNHRRSFLRHRRQEIALGGGEEGVDLADNLADHGPSPFERACDAETQRLIEAALAEINPDFRTVVVLRDLEELSYEEIAEVLQVNLGTVKSRILRGREALRKRLGGCLEPEPSSWMPRAAEGLGSR